MKADVKGWKKSVARISMGKNIFPGGGTPLPPPLVTGLPSPGDVVYVRHHIPRHSFVGLHGGKTLSK